jgi:mRNA interferase RelE/StbE
VAYKLFVDRSAERDLGKIDISQRRKVIEAIDELAKTPTPSGVRKLAGSDDTYRIRVGDYRLLYQIKDRELVVLVVRVAHRRDAYR